MDFALDCGKCIKDIFSLRLLISVLAGTGNSCFANTKDSTVNKLKGIAGVLWVLASTAAWADGEPTQEEFCESTSNRSRFEQLHKAGQIKGYRESLISGCDANARRAQDDRIDCKCFSEKLSETADEELFYREEIFRTFNLQLERADRMGDIPEYRLLEVEQQRWSNPNRIQKACSGES